MNINITEICEKQPTNLTADEFAIYITGVCHENQTTHTEIFIVPAHKPHSPTAYVVYYFMLVFAGFVFNLLVMLTIFFRTRLRTVPNAFMVSLSIADFLMATVAVPLRIVELLEQRNIPLTSVVYPFIGIASIFSLCCVTLDRYIHIRSTLNYEKHMNKTRAIAVVASIWVFSVLQACVFLVVKDNIFKEAIYNDVRLVCCFGFPAIFICVAYGKLFMVARAHARVIATTAITIPDRPWSQKKDFKILKNIALIVGTFIICWFPFLVSLSYELHASGKPGKRFYQFQSIAECFACGTCVINPIIYGFLRRHLRISMRYVVACKKESIEESQSL